VYCFYIHILLFLYLANIVLPVKANVGGDSPAAWSQFLESLPARSDQEQLLLLKRYLQKHPDCERVYFKILNLYRGKNDVRGAEQFFENKCLKPECRHNSYWALANLYAKEKNFSKALSAFHIALRDDIPQAELYKDYIKFLSFSKVQPGAADTLFIVELAAVHRSLFYACRDYYTKKFNPAIVKLQLLMQTTMDKKPILYMLGYSLVESGRYAQADSVISAGLALAQQEQDQEYVIKFTCLSGYRYLVQKNYQNAETDLCAALEQANKLESVDFLDLINESLATLYYSQQDYAAASIYYEHALIADSLFDIRENTGIFYYFLANSRYMMRQFSQALNCLENSQRYIQQADNKALLFNIHLFKRSIYDALLQYEMSESEYNKAVTLAEKENLLTPELSSQLASIRAGYCLNNGEYARGRDMYLQVIPHYSERKDSSNLANGLAQIGWSWWKQKEHNKAADYYRQACKCAPKNDPTNAAWYHLKAAENEALCGKYDNALAGIDSIIQQGQAVGNIYLLRNAYLRKGRVYEWTGNFDQAILNYMLAIPYIESYREALKEEEFRIGYFSDNYQVYRGLVRCYYARYLQSADPAELDSLYLYEEMQRGRALKDIIQEKQKRPGTGAENPAFSEACVNLQQKQREMRLRAGVSHSDEQWDRLMSELEAARYELIVRKIHAPDSLEYDRAKNQQNSLLSLEHLQNNLRRHNCGLIMYHLDDSSSFALVATLDTAGVVPLSVDADTLQQMVMQLVIPLRESDELTISEIPFNARLAYRLYTLLFQPIAERYDLPERLFIVPDGALLNLPFELLLHQAPEKPVYTPADPPVYAGYFLQQKHAFFYSPTSAVFREKKFTRPGRKAMLIVANPYTSMAENADKMLQFRARTGWRFEPLPFADIEGQRIKELSPGARLFNRDKAIEDVVFQQAGQYNIMHFATHAFVDTSFDAFSGLILSAGEDSTRDGIIMGYEIKSMQLDCDLVTLSACETGRGKVVQAEGVLGLPRLFLGAGARAVLISHWKVDDRFTSQLMPEFYRLYLQEKMTRADALACARRNLLATDGDADGLYYQHPFFWAAFTLYGDPGPATTNPMPVVALAGGVLGIITGLCWFFKKKKK